MSPKVSIVMSVYKDRGWLLESIRSVLEQTFDDYEFVIIDDLSPDDALTKLKRVAEEDARIRVVPNEQNLGLTRSLYKGVAIARGKFIARIDEGDLWHPDKLALQVVFLDQNPDYVLVGSQFLNICDTNGRRTPGTKLPGDWPSVWRWLISGKTPCTHPSILFRNGVVNYNRDATTSQDFEVYLRLAHLGKIANLDLSLVEVLRPSEAISTRKQHIQFFNHLIMHKQFIRSIKEGTREEFAKNGVDFGVKPFFVNCRMGYMRLGFSLIGYDKGGTLKKCIRVLVLPELLLYKVYQKYCALIYV